MAQLMTTKALLARRLVEAGVTFVLVSGAWGYFDHHGDEVRWGGIEKGLKPLMPSVDRVVHTLVGDLEQGGLLDSTMVLMMGEFGRGPVMTKTAGRDHWTNCMSMLAFGGGIRGGRVYGASDRIGGYPADRPLRPQDLAATIFHLLGIDPHGFFEATFPDPHRYPVGLPYVIVNGRQPEFNYPRSGASDAQTRYRGRDGEDCQQRREGRR